MSDLTHSTDATMEQKRQTTRGWTHFLATPRNSQGYPFSRAVSAELIQIPVQLAHLCVQQEAEKGCGSSSV